MKPYDKFLKARLSQDHVFMQIRSLMIGMIILCAFTLFGCTTKRVYPPTINVDLTREVWQSQVESNPNKWTAGADRWFLTGNPSKTQVAILRAPYSAAVSTLSVAVPNFTKIKVNANVEVQIFGTQRHNSVYVYGPNQGVRQLAI